LRGQAGTVASAIRLLAKAIMTGSGPSEEFFRRSDLDSARGNLTSDRLGRELIVRFLEGVPSINDGTVQQQLANLKSSRQLLSASSAL
jgi:hypothetical protein